MADNNALTVNEKNNLIPLMEGQDGLADLMKPLIREIELFDSYVAGTAYLKDKSVLTVIQEGDRLKLQREDNRFDANAILVLLEDGRKLGYVPERDNVVFARLMDAGKMLTAKIKRIQNRGSFEKICITISLVDL